MMDAKYFWYALPVLLAMAVGFAMMNDIPALKILPYLVGIVIVALAFYFFVFRAKRD
ncbi:hypothetical protein [Micrococcus luteus]|uniref:hypothetical protein n=2 Tax=Micrococcus luteus TaxID=1270 RepID=UPI003D330DBA